MRMNSGSLFVPCVFEGTSVQDMWYHLFQCQWNKHSQLLNLELFSERTSLASFFYFCRQHRCCNS